MEPQDLDQILQMTGAEVSRNHDNGMWHARLPWRFPDNPAQSYAIAETPTEAARELYRIWLRIGSPPPRGPYTDAERAEMRRDTVVVDVDDAKGAA